MIKTLLLNGWAQPQENIQATFPEGKILDYSHADSCQDFLASIENKEVDVLVGWSLGGQLALQAVSEGLLSPKLLVLLSPPFQYVSNSEHGHGVSRETFDLFKKQFHENPLKTQARFRTLTLYGEQDREQLALLEEEKIKHPQIRYWLNHLGERSCKNLNFSKLPRTLVFHGAEDRVVNVEQICYFKQHILDGRFEIFENCGHAPHLHHGNTIREITQDEYRNVTGRKNKD